MLLLSGEEEVGGGVGGQTRKRRCTCTCGREILVPLVGLHLSIFAQVDRLICCLDRSVGLLVGGQSVLAGLLNRRIFPLVIAPSSAGGHNCCLPLFSLSLLGWSFETGLCNLV